MGGSDGELLEQWRAAYDEPVPPGWDFAEFAGRVEESEPPWSYEELARAALAGAGSALDLGTGGGEFLLGIGYALPADTHATEGWPPNLPVARDALRPHGIDVAEYDAERGDALPYPVDRFDVVLSRHEAYSAREVMRVLRPSGLFLTQQVDGHNMADLAAWFGDGPAYPDVTLGQLRSEAERVGFEIVRAEEWSGPIRFADVNTLVSYCRLMPWQLPGDFEVDRYARELLALHHTGLPPVFTERRFVLACRKPAAGWTR